MEVAPKVNAETFEAHWNSSMWIRELVGIWKCFRICWYCSRGGEGGRLWVGHLGETPLQKGERYPSRESVQGPTPKPSPSQFSTLLDRPKMTI